MFFRPTAETLQRFDQGATQPGEGVFHLGRHHWMNGAPDQAVALQTAQSLGQHFLRDAANLALQFDISLGPMGQDLNNKGGPFVGDAIQDQARRALRIEDGTVG